MNRRGFLMLPLAAPALYPPTLASGGYVKGATYVVGERPSEFFVTADELARMVARGVQAGMGATDARLREARRRFS